MTDNQIKVTVTDKQKNERVYIVDSYDDADAIAETQINNGNYVSFEYADGTFEDI